MDVKMPVLLGSALEEIAVLHPTKGSLRLEAQGVSECQLTLGDKSAEIPMHGWVKIFNQNGLVGIFRRTSRNNNISVDKIVTLRHGIDILQDSVFAAQEDFTGTRAQFLTAVLNQQTSLIGGVKPWVLGTCADTRTVTKSLNYDNLLDLLLEEAEDGGDYYYTFDQSVFPWRVNLVAKPAGVRSEFRLNRNIEKCRISDNDSEICTRLILNVNKTDKNADPDTPDELKSIYRVYNNTAAQASYGIIVKTADIDVTQDTLPGGPFPEADAWAADFLAKRAAPQLQIQIDGLVLKEITGDTWDESRLAEQCRVALPEYSEAIEQRVVTIQYPDLYGTPQRITVSLANVLPSYSQSLKAVTKETTAIAKETRTYSRQEDSFNKYFAILDRQGNVLRQAGMKLDANGFLVYADDNENMVGARFEVQANKIGMVVGTGASGNFIKAGEIALAINDADESVAHIDANHVNISATSTLHTLAGAIEEDDQGNLVIKSAGGMRVRRTEQGVTSEFGVFDNGNLTAGIMVDKINGQTSAHLNADNIYIGNQSSVTVINGKAEITDLNAVKARVSTIEADYITADNITSKVGSSMNFTVGRLTASEISTPSLTVGGKYLDAGLVLYDVYATTGSDGTITLYYANGTSRGHEIISFSRATLTSLTGSWSGTTYTASAMDPGGTVLATVSTNISRSWAGNTLNIVSGSSTLLTEAFTGGTGLGASTQGTPYTINTFNSSHKAFGYVDATSHPAGRMFSFNVDATSEYNAGSTEGYTTGHTAGYAEGRTDYRPGSITQDTANKQITVLNDAGDSLATYSVATTYNAGVTAGEGKFSRAAITLQGASEAIVPIGTAYKYTSGTLYKGDGGGFYGRGVAVSAYIKQGDTYVAKTLYAGDGVYHYDRGHTVTGALTPDDNGSVTRYAAGTAMTRYKAGTSYTTTNSPYYTKS